MKIIISLLVLLLSCTGCVGHLLVPMDANSEVNDAIAYKEARIDMGGETSYEKALKKYMDAMCEMDIDTLEKLSPYTNDFGSAFRGNMGGYTRIDVEEEIKSMKEDGYKLIVKEYKITEVSDGAAKMVNTYNEKERLKGKVEAVKYVDIKLTTLWKPSDDYDVEEETSDQKAILLQMENRWYVESMDMQ